MGKQKIEIKVTMENAKRRTKALTVAVGQPGVISAQVDGEKIVVIGDGIDSAALTIKLRKKMCFADLISASAVEEKKEGEKEEKKEGEKEEKKEGEKE
ncbi:heavy metal-associated isoprenylated plant protein 47-like, partial [Asparagus officinalis]|uniref:heavy metal-associated isoprenylated plant protein 47-like n=1 Tax=Asparagus officinalis TaxID=4686 RepID=UPI00098E23E1